ncbi:hypothetical protein [Noviherbaspirillum aerium]|uniref:hypothetical protein n=1 Tax=Noviherbaspirillum aerium TaxID=2588497 RepID=UPI001CEF9B04|nr:hypothetical protein [Noviherbaspirillum aerium]
MATSDEVRSLPYNRDMSHLDILIPFALPPAELAADLLREVDAPALATLLSRSKSEPAANRHERFDDFARALPHETWMVRRFGLLAQLERSGSPPVGAQLLRSTGAAGIADIASTAVDSGFWFVIQPVYIHIARDHLVLTDPRQLMLTETESRHLFEIAKPLFEESGRDLRFCNESTWLLRSDDWAELATSSPDAAGGHNIDIWMPRGPGEREWRKVQNEVQMHWFQQAFNDEREERGLKPVNSLWLWGGSNAAMPAGTSPYGAVFNLNGWMAAVAASSPRHLKANSVAELAAAESGPALLALDDLVGPALSNDWAEWIAAFNRLEKDWFAPLHERLKSGKMDALTPILTNDSRLFRCTASRSSLRKFWVKPNLASLST